MAVTTLQSEVFNVWVLSNLRLFSTVFYTGVSVLG